MLLPVVCRQKSNAFENQRVTRSPEVGSNALASYLNYLLPVLIGRMGGWVFTLAMILSVLASGALTKRLADLEPDPGRARWTLGWSPALVLFLIAVFYVLKWTDAKTSACLRRCLRGSLPLTHDGGDSGAED